MSMQETVKLVFTQVAQEQGKALEPLRPDLPLLESGLDSLCLAVIVARLESKLGIDPFSAAEDVPLPVTFGDFVELYENVAA
jgi:acyl carrier protein